MRKTSIITYLTLITTQALLVMALGSPALAQSAEQVDIESPRWVIKDDKAKREEFLGKHTLFLANGFAYLNDFDFEDGVIEVDVASMPVAFPGIVFRFKSADEHELVYLRPHHSGHDDATQYVPAFLGAHPWQIYNGKGYTAAANVPTGEWIHMKIEVNGLTARVWLGTSSDPVLVITDLKHGFSRGSIGVTAGAMGAHFANFSFLKSSTASNHATPKYPSPAPGTLTNWELSDAFSADSLSAESVPADSVLKKTKWERVAAEDPGMIVIDRYRRSPTFVPPFAFDRGVRLNQFKEAKLVMARTTLQSDRDQIVRMGLGYSDEVTVFLNGQPLFNGKSAWRFRDQDFNGIMDPENDAVYLPLKKGKNELILAVKEYFGGWGFICRLASTNGVTINR